MSDQDFSSSPPISSLAEALETLDEVDRQVLQILIKRRLLQEGILKYLVNFIHRWEVNALKALRQTHLLTETQIADALAAELKLDRIYQPFQCTLADRSPYWLPFRVARKNHLIFLQRDGDGDDLPGEIELVCANPCDRTTLTSLYAHLNFRPPLVVSESREVLKAIDFLYPLEDQMPWLREEQK